MVDLYLCLRVIFVLTVVAWQIFLLANVFSSFIFKSISYVHAVGETVLSFNLQGIIFFPSNTRLAFLDHVVQLLLNEKVGAFVFFFVQCLGCFKQACFLDLEDISKCLERSCKNKSSCPSWTSSSPLLVFTLVLKTRSERNRFTFCGRSAGTISLHGYKKNLWRRKKTLSSEDF